MPQIGKRKGSAMNIEIAQRLYELRRKHGFSQESLAAELGLSRQAISKWERSESAPDMGNLIALADLYGMTIDELIRPSEETDRADGASIEDFDADDTNSDERVEIVETAEDGSNTEDLEAATVPSDIAVAVEEVETSEIIEPVEDEPSTGQSGSSDPIEETPDDIKQVFAHGHLYTKPPKPASPPKCALRRFPYPLAVTALFLLLALIFGLWEYMWLFLTIPFYYWICRIIERDPNFLAAHGHSEGGQR